MDVDRLVIGNWWRVGLSQNAKANLARDLRAVVSVNQEFVAIGEKFRTSVECHRLCGGRKNLPDHPHFC